MKEIATVLPKDEIETLLDRLEKQKQFVFASGVLPVLIEAVEFILRSQKPK